MGLVDEACRPSASTRLKCSPFDVKEFQRGPAKQRQIATQTLHVVVPYSLARFL